MPSADTNRQASQSPHADDVRVTRTDSERLANFVAAARYEMLPEQVVTKAKEQIVFFLARAFEGRTSGEAQQLRRVLASAARADGVTVIGHEFRLAPAEAAFANCSLMRGAGGRDDVLWPAGIHAGVIALPTALAMSEKTHATGRELLLAFVLAYEVMGKLGRAAESWAAKFPRRPTNVFGSFGPVTAAGRLLRLDSSRLANAYGYAANLGTGIPEGGMMDHYYSLVNRNGILATELANKGGAAYSNMTIEGSAGLYRSFFGSVPRALAGLVDRLGVDWEIMGAEQKRYPGTGQHAVAIDMLLKLIASDGLTASQVSSIEVVEPDADDSDIRKREVAFAGPFIRAVQAYSSLPYALAIALHDGHMSLARYPDEDDLALINDPAIAQLMSLVTLHFESGHASSRYCRLEVKLRTGHVVRREVESFSFPFPREAWGPALQEFGLQILGGEQLRRLEALIADLQDLGDVANLMAVLSPAMTGNQLR